MAIKQCPNPECKYANSPGAQNCEQCFVDIAHIAIAVEDDKTDVTSKENAEAHDWLGSGGSFEEPKTSPESVSDFTLESDLVHSSSALDREVSNDLSIRLRFDEQIVEFKQGVILGRHSPIRKIGEALTNYGRVSRLHCWVGLIHREIYVIDLNSKRGTSVIIENSVKNEQNSMLLTPQIPICLGKGSSKLSLAASVDVLISIVGDAQ